MITIMFEAMAVLLIAAVAIHSVILHVRLSRFRKALGEIGQVLPNLDASVGEMTAVSKGFAQRLQADLQTVDGRLAAARKAGAELAAAHRAAEEAAVQLERLLRMQRRAETPRPAPLPRDQVEPKGFAARAGLEPVSSAGDSL
ncbi:MAG TPA: hypothetical protein VHO91_12340 [Rhodopila sp.]|nr:hypothetical protein [Rhodopila sp.]